MIASDTTPIPATTSALVLLSKRPADVNEGSAAKEFGNQGFANGSAENGSASDWAMRGMVLCSPWREWGSRRKT